MVFTSFIYLYFFAGVFSVYWLLKKKNLQNPFLLICSYLFYGYIHPWFCILIAVSTVVDYICGLGMVRFDGRKKLFLIISLICNLGMLGFFKYFNFFADSIHQAATSMGLNFSPITLKIFLPVGISFYTFQTLSYTIDIYRDKLKPRKNFFDFALFVAFFPQLVAGPIERASRLLPQVETKRKWDTEKFLSAWPLLVRGYLKKLVIADNVAVYVNQIFMLEKPTLLLLFAGTVAFAIQIYADFSAYTDIARASARLLGFDLIKNFKSPYLAISPSDFWRRWHISFSSWIRDYLYIPLGGSKVSTQFKMAFVLLVSLGLSGLWHGAAWNFIAWGVYHAILLFAYRSFGLAGRWQPQTRKGKLAAVSIMFMFTLFGWAIFRTSSMTWLLSAFTSQPNFGFSGQPLIAAMVILFSVIFYSLPLFVLMLIDRVTPKSKTIHAVVYGMAIVAITVLFRDSAQDFIYFQF